MMATLRGLGLFNGRQPPYATMLLFELHRLEEQPRLVMAQGRHQIIADFVDPVDFLYLCNSDRPMACIANLFVE